MATEAFDALFANAGLARAVTVGTLAAFADSGEPLVDVGTSGCVAARSIVQLDDAAVGREVAVLFEGGDATRPLIIGLIQSLHQTSRAPIELEADGKRVVLTGEQEVVLRCGKASIQLSSDGTVRIRGTNVLSRAAGTNRIRGGNVQIN